MTFAPEGLKLVKRLSVIRAVECGDIHVLEVTSVKLERWLAIVAISLKAGRISLS